MALGIKSSAFLRVEETGASNFEAHTCLLVGTLGKKLFQGLVLGFLTCHPLEKYTLKKSFQASWVQKSYLILSSTSTLSFPLCMYAGMPWHGMDPGLADLWWAWHGKSWHGTARKILARKNIGTAWPGKNVMKLFYYWKICWVEKSETFS